MRSAGKAGYWETTPHEGARLTGKDSKPNQDCTPKTTPKRQKKGEADEVHSNHALHVRCGPAQKNSDTENRTLCIDNEEGGGSGREGGPRPKQRERRRSEGWGGPQERLKQ